MKHSIIALTALLMSGCYTSHTNERNQFDALNQALVDLSNAQIIKTWNRFSREVQISDQDINNKLVEWIKRQPLEFDHEWTDSLAKGSVCGCLPVIIYITEERRIQIHGHNLIIFPEKIAYKSSADTIDIHEVLILLGILNEPMMIDLPYSSAVVLYDLLTDLPSSRQFDDATREAIYTFTETVGDKIDWPKSDEDYKNYIPKQKERILQGW